MKPRSAPFSTRTLWWTPRPSPRVRHQPMSRLVPPALPPIRSVRTMPARSLGECRRPSPSATAEAKLSLKLNRRDAGRLAGDQISRPKPCAQRHMAAFHDGANRQARIVAALATAQDTGTSGDAEGIACGMAMRTDEAVAPSSFFHVGSTLRFIGKKLLKLWKRPRKGQVVTLKDVHGSLSIIHTKSIPSGCVRQADRQATSLR